LRQLIKRKSNIPKEEEIRKMREALARQYEKHKQELLRNCKSF